MQPSVVTEPCCGPRSPSGSVPAIMTLCWKTLPRPAVARPEAVRRRTPGRHVEAPAFPQLGEAGQDQAGAGEGPRPAEASQAPGLSFPICKWV